MKFRVLASAAALALLLATTACGTGNLANNAYGVNRAYDGNVRHGVTANRTAGGNTAGTTRMTGSTSNARTNTGGTARRLGNAAHNAGSGLGLERNVGNNGLTGGTNTGRRAGMGIGRRTNQTATSGAMRARGRFNRDGGYQMGLNGHNSSGGAGYNGRVDSTSDLTSLRQTGGTLGAYDNPNNFDNAVYRHQGQGQRGANNLTPAIDGVRNSGNQNLGGRTMVGIDNSGGNQVNNLGSGRVNNRGNSTVRNLANNSYLTNDVNLMDGLNAGNGVVRNTNRTVQSRETRQNTGNSTRRRNTAVRNVQNVRNNTANTGNMYQTRDSVAR